MAYEDAYLTKDFRVWMGGNVSGSNNEEADAVALGSASALIAAIGATDDVATLNGWTEVSTNGWGLVRGNYPGPSSELVDQDGAADAVYRQDLGVQDLAWNFQIDANAQTVNIFGGLRQKRRRLIVAPNGVATGRSVDQFVAWVSAPTQDNRGKQQYNVTVSLNGPVTVATLT